MRYRYLDDFRHVISVFAIFSYGIVVLGTLQCPHHQVDELEKTLVSFFMWIVCRNPLERGGIENQDFKNALLWEP